MLAGHFKVHGITITDIQKFTGYANVKKLCSELGIELYELSKNRYSPLSTKDVKRLLIAIRSMQGSRFAKRIKYSTDFGDHGAEFAELRAKK